jgi:LAS superfamily LD-carboxypeptidase LdcB
MKRNFLKMNFENRALILLLAAILLVSLISCGDKNETETEEQEEYMMTSLDYEYKTDVSAYAEILNTTSDACLILANKTCLVGENYVPDKVIKLDTDYTFGGKNVELAEYAAVAVEALISEMRAHGIDDVYVTSGYRDYAYQASLFERYCNNERDKHPTWSEDRIKEEVLTYSAYPGTSEHQTGLCVDLMTTEMEGLWNFGSETPNNPYDKGFAETEAFEWLKDNAHKFGFILRYPEDKTNITGYSYESWHYRFVGIGAASKIHENGLTLEEYLEK